MVTGHTPGEGAAFTFTLKAEPTQRKGIEAPPEEVLKSIRRNQGYINEQTNTKIVLHLLLFGWRYVLADPYVDVDPDSVHLEMACLEALLEGESTTKRTFLETCRKGVFWLWIQALALAVSGDEIGDEE